MTAASPSDPSLTPADKALPLVGAAWGIFGISIWAGWMVLTRLDLGHSGLTTYDITALRFATAAALLLPIVVRNGAVAPRVGVGGTAIMVVGAGAPYALIAATGLLYAPAAHAAALIPGVMPLFAALLSVIILRERISRERLLGLAVIPFGVLLIAGPGLLGPIGPRSIGHLLFLSASFLWACFTVTLRRSGVSPLHGAAIVALWSALLFLPVYVFAKLPSGLAQASWTSIGLEIVYQGVLTSIVSLIAFSKSVAILGASRAAVFASLVPSLATIFAIPVLGEVPSAAEAAGIVLVTTGVLLGSGAVGQILANRATGASRRYPTDDRGRSK